MPAWVSTRRRQIGDRIRTTRRQIGLSQLQLGELVGRDHKTIHRWETAATPPDLNDLLLLADALQVPLSDLVQ
jgi:transcriptional regulator with XRE-family HTH domain